MIHPLPMDVPSAPEHLQTSLPWSRAGHRALIPPKQIQAEQELLQKLTQTFYISYCNKSLLPLRTDFLPLLLMLTGHLPPKQTSTTCLGGMMVSIYPGCSHHFQTAFKQVAPGGNTLCSPRRAHSSALGWGVCMGRSCPFCRGALAGVGSSSPPPSSAAVNNPRTSRACGFLPLLLAKPCPAPPSARLQLVNGL